jgi:hypothetical protein
MPSPKPSRVALRALVFSAITVRAYLETERAPDTAQYHAKMLRWLESRGVRPEFEQEELAFVQAEIGQLTRARVAEGMWRSEALGVLAWALGYGKLPPYHEEVDQQSVAKSLGFMHGAGVLRSPELRERRELVRYGKLARALHWRLREMKLRKRAVDWEKVAGRLPFLAVEGIELVDGDLALLGKPLFRAKTASVSHALSMAYQRHQAINWLVSGGARYSETDTPT